MAHTFDLSNFQADNFEIVRAFLVRSFDFFRQILTNPDSRHGGYSLISSEIKLKCLSFEKSLNPFWKAAAAIHISFVGIGVPLLLR